MKRLRMGAWLDASLARFVASAFALLALAGFAFLIFAGEGSLDRFGRPVGTDFSAFYTAGRLALEGQASQAYDWSLHRAAQEAVHGRAGIETAFWVYPPVFFLVVAPLAALPYLTAFVAWQGATLAFALTALRRILPGRDALILGLGFPAVLLCVGHGHNALLTAALLASGCLSLRTRPALAGVFFGCLAYKPQLALLVPVVLAAGGHWRTLVTAGATASALCLATLLFVGPLAWETFFNNAPTVRALVLENGGLTWDAWTKLQSAFGAVRRLGGSVEAAYALQGGVSVGAVLACGWLWRRPVADELKFAGLLVGTVLTTPHLLDYDLLILGPAIAFLVAHGRRCGFAPWEVTLLAACWAVPAVARALTTAGIPAAFVLTLTLFGFILKRAAEANAVQTLRPVPA